MLEQGRSFSGREPNCCFLNLRGGRFATVSAVSGLDFPDDGRAVAVVDWDQDGDLDLWISNRNAPRLRLMRNDTSRDHHFVMLRLRGNGKSTNRDAIGARVEVVASGLEGRPLIRTLRAGEGFLAQSSKSVHIGLGLVEQIDKIIVHWPGGEPEAFENIEVDQRYQLVQGTSEAKRLDLTTRVVALESADQPAEVASGNLRVPLVTPLPMPGTIAYTDFDGAEQQLNFHNTSRPTLIVLWASWCLPCWEELKDLTSRQQEIESAGINLVALSVDGLGDERADQAAAQKLCQQLKIPYTVGKANAEFVQLMTGYHHMLIALKKLLPVPASFLVDRQGRLTVIYKGRLDIDQLLKDAQSDPQTLRERWARAACLPGRTIDHDGLYHSLRRAEANTLCAMGNAFGQGSRFEEAIPFLRAALKTEPEFGVAHQGLAQMLQFTGRHAEAAEQYNKAIKHFPERAFLHYQLGEVRLLQERMEEALGCYGEALKRKKDYWEAHIGRANVMMRSSRPQDAAVELRAALKINPGLESARHALRQLEDFNR